MPDARLEIHVLTAHASEPAVLVRDGGSALPGAIVRISEDHPSIQVIGPWLRDALGLDVPILETHLRWDGEGGVGPDPIPGLVWTEAAPPGWQPPDGVAWRPIRGLEPGLPAILRPRAAELLAELLDDGAPPALRPRWARPGWYARAAGWMSDRLAELDRAPTAKPMQTHLRGISALLRAPTPAGPAHLKAVFPPFHAEPAITTILAARFPGLVTTPIATEADEGWLLMEDLGGHDVRSAGGDAEHEAGIRALVEIQRAMAVPREHDALLAAGSPHRPLGRLAKDLAGALDDELARSSPKARPDLAATVATVEVAMARVAALGFPETVVHGDFHPGNVALVEGRPVVFDWSDAAIGDPAIDLVTWFDDDVGPDRKERVLAAWTDAWSTTIDPVAARAAVHDILLVGAAYQVVSYVDILRNLEPATRYTLDHGLDHYLALLDRPGG